MKHLLTRWILIVFVVPGVVSLVCGPSFGQGGKAPKQLTKQQQQALRGLSKDEIAALAKLDRNQKMPVFKSSLSSQGKAEAVRELDMALAKAKRGKLSRELTMSVRQWEKLSQTQKEQLLSKGGGSVASTPVAIAAGLVALVVIAEATASWRTHIATRRMNPRELDLVNAAQLQVGLIDRNPIPGPRPAPGPRPIGGIEPPKPDPRPGPDPLPDSRLNF